MNELILDHSFPLKWSVQMANEVAFLSHSGSVLVLSGMQCIFSLVAGAALCFGFSVRALLITPWCSLGAPLCFLQVKDFSEEGQEELRERGQQG